MHTARCYPCRAFRAILFPLLLASLAFLAGCGRFSTLKTEVSRLESDLYLRGQIAGPVAPTAPVNVLVFVMPQPKSCTILDTATLQPGDDSFAFSLPPGGPYYIVAYEDKDRNGRYDAGEPGWVYGKPDPIDFNGKRRSARLDVALDPNLKPSADLVAALRAARQGRSIAELTQGHRMPISLGQIAALDAPRFDPEVGQIGLWQPATFLNEHGVGVYFAKPYDPKLIPVLLVHGAGGTPRVWIDFAPRLDPNRFQVWYYFYPSGARLERAAEALETAVADLHARYKFPRLDVVAHSMGGMVSRSYLLQAKQAGHAGWLRHFVTLSTPWGGHEAAALGVEHAPTAIPSWIDMQTNSEFAQKIYAEKLPAGMTYDLVFTFRGSGSFVLPESNDGSVSIASQLYPPAQEAARSIRGFDETHVGVLHAEAVAQWVQSLLSEKDSKKLTATSAAPLGQ